jgi:hypothetical protein
VGQVLASFKNCMVVVGGWIPDLLITDSDEPHSGSIDVDIALDAEKLNNGRYRSRRDQGHRHPAGEVCHRGFFRPAAGR